MSWDIVIFRASKEINLNDSNIEEYLEPFDFKNSFEEYFHRINRINMDFWEIIGEGFTIDYSVNKEACTNIMVSVYGENGLFELINMAKKYNLQIYDTSLDKFLDLNCPENNGFHRFNDYVKQILNS